ncbi:thioredoxin domain-containing protein [Defluviimonas aestuarii]|uniref:thioredoxin domain-containing protein n=1 Tax=Albidovulum aestuarii TaxID=1130726 RepID=UPI00249C09B8|nr:thioredoxin domain-containing protein [Defluviimonas aestuarii]MDI3337240.1 thioredoxin domain-containing protein [Defluviimonas aestuarii]
MSESLKLTCAACGQMNRFPTGRLNEAPKCAVCGAGLVSGKVAELDLAMHDKATRGDDLPILIDYWAPWCGPCRMMAPEFAKAAQSLKGRVRFAKINTQDFPAVSQRLGIRGIPLLILWHRGRELARLPGARPAAEIETFARTNTATPV